MMGSILHLASDSGGTRVAAAFLKGTVQVWDLHTGAKVSEFETVLDFGGRRLALSPDGTLCVAAAWRKGKLGGVACYDAATGSKVWHRVDIRQTQSVRFSKLGNGIYCGLERGRLQHLSAATGETLDSLSGLSDVIDSRHSEAMLWDVKGRDLRVKGSQEFRIARSSFALLDAVFSQDALCLSEAGGPVRCIDPTSGAERWRYQPAGGRHVIRMSQYLLNFYGLERQYERFVAQWLVRFSEGDGRVERIRELSVGEHEFSSRSNVMITSDGQVIRITDGKTIRKLDFPQTEYCPDRNP